MKRICIALIRFYQKHISPALPSCCRYVPTCSQYAIEAIEKRGVFVGIFLAVKRLFRHGNAHARALRDEVGQTSEKRAASRKHNAEVEYIG